MNLEKKERNHLILEMRLLRYKLWEIGKKFGITKQRVSQIIKRVKEKEGKSEIHN